MALPTGTELETVSAADVFTGEFPWQKHDWTVQQVRFASEYLSHGNGPMAYLRSHQHDGEPEHKAKINAYQRSARLLGFPWMQGYLAHVRAAMVAQMSIMGRDEVLAELSKIGRANMADFMVLSEDGKELLPDFSALTRAQMAAIAEVTIDVYVERTGPDEGRAVKSIRFKLAPKTPALELLGKHHRLFADVIEDNRTEVADTIRARRHRAGLGNRSENDVSGSDQSDGNGTETARDGGASGA